MTIATKFCLSFLLVPVKIRICMMRDNLRSKRRGRASDDDVNGQVGGELGTWVVDVGQEKEEAYIGWLGKGIGG